MQQSFENHAFIPRRERDHARARRAVAHLKPGLAAALQQIEVQFNQAAVFNSRKLAVERILARGVESIDTALRYLKCIRRCQQDCFDLDQAVSAIALARRIEEGAAALARADYERCGYSSYSGPITIYRELHILLRFMRAKGMRREFNRAVYGVDIVPLVPAAVADRVPA
jgi:hypothetical protein